MSIEQVVEVLDASGIDGVAALMAVCPEAREHLGVIMDILKEKKSESYS